ncbi:MAG TPA: FAD-dependent oxidoreductase [Polyangiales bacterium]
MSATRKTARLTAARMLSPSVRSLGLTLMDGDGPLSFEAGQWVDLYVRTGQGEQKRAYSIASAAGAGLLEIAVTRVEQGAASNALHELPLGAELGVSGPFGLFTREAAQRQQPALFVATGTGLSPLRSMLFDWQTQAARAPITLLFGVRSEADVLWGDELAQWAARDPAFRLEVTLSRAGEGWRGRRGYVQQHVAELARELDAPHVFICGLNRMVSEVRALCKGELGLDRKRIHSERYD